MNKIFTTTVFLLLLLLLSGCATMFLPLARTDCVQSAISNKKVLEARGYETRIQLGLCATGEYSELAPAMATIRTALEDGRMDGHAWVEYKNKKTGEWMQIDTLRRISDSGDSE